VGVPGDTKQKSGERSEEDAKEGSDWPYKQDPDNQPGKSPN
jgi:hypothetical protein